MRRSRVSLLNRSKILSPSNFTGAPNQTVNINVSGTNAIVRDKNNVSDEYKKNDINAIDKDIINTIKMLSSAAYFCLNATANQLRMNLQNRIFNKPLAFLSLLFYLLH